MMQIQGAASGRRAHTKNKKWVAGQGDAKNGRANEGERWERGGHRRRGGGRGRGQGHYDTHLTVPSDGHDGDNSATEDDGGSAASGMEDEVEQPMPEPESKEDLEKFYQEVRYATLLRVCLHGLTPCSL